MTSKNDSSGAVGANYHKLESSSQLQTLLGEDLNRLSVLYFRADWYPAVEVGDNAVKSLAQKYSEPLYLEIEAERLTEVTETFEVESIPSLIILRGHKLLSRIIGDDYVRLEADIEKYVKAGNDKQIKGRYEVLSQTTQKPAPPAPAENLNRPPANMELAPGGDESQEELFARCKQLMQQSKVVVFMKGDPRTPRCGFSQQTVKILQELNIEFTTFDILTDEKVRQGMKVLNAWPTFPQIIIKGELVGGLDILKEMIQKNGREKSELDELLQE